MAGACGRDSTQAPPLGKTSLQQHPNRDSTQATKLSLELWQKTNPTKNATVFHQGRTQRFCCIRDAIYARYLLACVNDSEGY